ncbi:Sugar transport protein [Thalictrum thalictroides]|uniref:Sugar transport protein n=1 Tax=Thalictrum thalictroides TaxID=46969 RepID=A0A7J6WCP4_THATH|nr:Sugar transport protein [Thalictrum thalictroides]
MSMKLFSKEFSPSVYNKQSGDQSSNRYCKFDSQIVMFFTSSVYLAASLSSLFASKITRKYGHQPTIALGGALYVFGSITSAGAAAQNIFKLIVGRILLGFGVGFTNQSVSLYLSEMAPCKIPGHMLFQLFVTLGIFLANCINSFSTDLKNYGQCWRCSLGLAAVPGLIVLLGGIFLPETPKSLIERNHPVKAKQLLKKMRGVDNVDEEYNDLVAANKASKKVKDSWRRLLYDTKYQPQLTFAIAVPLFQQFTGTYGVMLYAPVLLNSLGFGSSFSLMSARVIGCINAVATVVSTFVASDRSSRRKLFMEGGIQMIISQCAIGGLIWYKFGWSTCVGTLSRSFYPFILLASISCNVVGFAYSWSLFGPLLPSEICSPEVQSAAHSLYVSLDMFWAFVISQVFLVLFCRLKYLLFFGFAFLTLVTTIFIYSYLPETKGVPKISKPEEKKL